MDYEQKYKEALERARTSFSYPDYPGFMRVDVIFPELKKESEDERIRKELIEQIAYITPNVDELDDELNTLPTYQKRIDKYRAWLEKQGQEPKKVSIWKHWKNGIAGKEEGKHAYLIKMGNTYELSSCLGFECDYIELSELDNLMLEKQNNKSINIDVESMVSSYEERFKSQGGIKYGPLVNMCLTAFRHGAENVLKELNLKKLENKGEKNINHIDIKEKAHQIAWEASKNYDPSLSKESWCEMAALDMASWLEKQGVQKPTDNSETELHEGDWIVINETVYQITEIDDSHVVLSFNGRECKFGLEVLNNAQKFESQFKVGDWITNGDYTWKIVEVTPLDYILQSQDGDIVDDTISYVDKEFNLWTIHDAMEGDVLIRETGEPFIHNGNRGSYIPEFLGAYCGISDGRFRPNGSPYYWGRPTCPATKEQRDLLLQKMKESGYEWDADKKELKKVEQKPDDKIKPKFNAGDWITDGHLTCKVLSVTGKSYELHLYNDDYCHFETDVQSVDKHYHLWTINDAKDGDVLVTSPEKGSESNEQIFLFKAINSRDYVDNCIEYYCRLCDDVFYKNKVSYMGTTLDTFYPATKEQQELLFQKMKEEEYKLDSENKELKNIESKKVNASKVINWVNPDKVIEWLKNTIRQKAENYGVYKETSLVLPYNSIEDLINDFKEDFGL